MFGGLSFCPPQTVYLFFQACAVPYSFSYSSEAEQCPACTIYLLNKSDSTSDLLRVHSVLGNFTYIITAEENEAQTS